MTERLSFPVFEESDFWLDISSVTIGPQIGEGQFSRVFLGKYFGDYVAIKKQIRQDKVLDCYLLRELAVLKNASHENLVGYIGACNEVASNQSKVNALYIVTEFCQGGDLLGLLQSSHPLSWKFRVKIALDVANALKYLHRQNLIHRDIKSSNMLLDHKWTCKLSDFGMARELIGNDGHGGERGSLSKRMTICGTNEYMAPELLFDEEYGSAVDIFSFGMVLLEIMKRVQVGSNDFAVRRPQTGFNLERDEISSQLPSDAPPSLVLLSLQCCEYEAGNRPFSDDVQDWLADLYSSMDNDTIPLPPMNPLISFGEDSSPVPPPPTPMATITPSISTPETESTSTPSQKLSQDIISDSIKDLYSHSDGTAKTVLKAGYIWKKNNTGFRNWKFRWMVLTPFQLKWYANMNDRYEKGHLDLLDMRVKKTKQYRFVVLDAKEELELENNESTNYHREFSADGQETMEDWIQAIQLAIDNYRRLRVVSRTSIAAPVTTPIVLPVSSPNKSDNQQLNHNFKDNPIIDPLTTVDEWLSELSLSQYSTTFQNHGYTNLQMINEFGLQNEDLDFLEITHPLHRRVLSVCSLAEYSETIMTAIPEWQEVGSVVVYRVVARWRFARANVLMQYGDFKKLHSNILRTLTGPECTKLLSKLPSLPGKQLMVLNSRNTSFLNQRRQALEEYLISLANLMAGTPMMKILLETIGLTAKTVDKFDKKDVVDHDNFSHTRKEEIEL